MTLDELVEAVCDGTADAATYEALDRLLRDDPDAQRRYLRRIDLHHSLQWMTAGEATADAVRALRPRPVPMGRAVAAVLLVAVAAGLLVLPGPRVQAARPVAVLMDSPGAVWEGPTPTQGEALPPGRLTLRSGQARLLFYGGARALLQGPSALELTSPDSATLSSGRLTLASREGEFRLAAPGLDVALRAGELGLQAGDGVLLSVFEGEATATVALGIPVARRLIRDESLRLEPDGTLIADLVGAPHPFARLDGRRDPRRPAVANPGFEFPRVGPDGPLAAAGWVLQAHPLANAENMDVDAAAGAVEVGGRQWGYLTARTFPDGRRFHTSMHQAVGVLAAGATYELELETVFEGAGLSVGLYAEDAEPLKVWPAESRRARFTYACPPDHAADGRTLTLRLEARPAAGRGRVRIDDVRLSVRLPEETR
ncbi:MAG TPA: hypothetical protein VEJ18_13155 [Planctomycetota bacterium]|nr:hypothetical protein [Planctomycetota bacterium]